MLMIGKQLTAEQRLTKAVVDIMGQPKYIALAGILMLGTRKVVDDPITACTNGRDEMYGRKFIESLNDAELRFLVLHECYHKLFRHLITWRHLYEQDRSRANRACDYVINIKIADDNADGFATMPKDKKTGQPIGCIDEKYRGMDSAQVFNDLQDDGEGDGEGEAGDGDEGQAGGGGNDGGLDDHDWEGAQEMSDQELKDLERDIDEAIRQGALAAGKLGSGGDRDIEALLQPKVDWREVLREFVSTTCTGNDFSTWRRPNRRFISTGTYLPSGVSEQIGELVIGNDASGSIGQRELTEFLSEIQSIAQTVHPSAVRLLYWDTAVCRDEVYVGEDVNNIAQSTKPAGGGGTYAACVPEYMTKHGIRPQAVVMFTDGYVGDTWGQWSVPVLWCIKGADVTAPVGKTVHIKD